MRLRPLISVVLPCFDAQRWIGAALRSILRQSIGDFELLVVDDGSRDSSAAVIDKMSASDRRIRLLRGSENLGIVAALNRGLDECRGSYIARMDADDIAVPQRFERQLEFIQRTATDLCGSWYLEFGRGLPRIARWAHEEEPLRAALLFQNSICHPTVMARREVFDQYRYREAFRLAEDYDLFSRVSAKYRVGNVPEVLLHYRRHRSQVSVARRAEMEQVTRRIRLEALAQAGISADEEEKRLHNLIRSPYSIHQKCDLMGIEAWLVKLAKHFPEPEAKRVVALQWVRACIRAAPLGREMWRLFRASPLSRVAGDDWATLMDLRILAGLRLDYRSRAFELLRRFGVSA